jgi:hypothetical protein
MLPFAEHVEVKEFTRMLLFDVVVPVAQLPVASSVPLDDEARFFRFLFRSADWQLLAGERNAAARCPGSIQLI